MHALIQLARKSLNRLFDWFEQRVEPFPAVDGATPPKKPLAFVFYYTQGMWPWLILSAVLTATIAVLEIWLFGFLANIVDWLGKRDPATFLSEEQGSLILMAVVVLVFIPATYFLHTLLMHQTVYGNYPMAIRWRAHRYLLNQSFSFFQDEFAGRIATKLLQTSLAVRETVMKVLDVLIYVGVYFLGALVLMSTFNVLIVLPFLVWLAAYIGLLRYYLPKLRDISRAQADARSEMTGRIVDSYTNIQTVKLFAHAGHEVSYAKAGMLKFLNTVHPQMRRVTELNTVLSFLNSVLLFGVGAVGINQWVEGAVSVGGVAIAIGLVLRSCCPGHVRFVMSPMLLYWAR